MTLPEIGTLASLPALDHPELLAPPVAAALAAWPAAADVAVVEIDPEHADTAAMSAAYDVPMDASANCVVVAGQPGREERVAACVVRADTRADVNNLVKQLLDVRKASFLSMDRAVEESGMEYGGITPVGLPDGWRLLVDPRCLDIEVAIIGSGIRRSKILLPGRLARRAARRGGRGWAGRLRGTGAHDRAGHSRARRVAPGASRPEVGRPAPGAAGHPDRRPAPGGFLLTLPFQQKFGTLDEFQRRLLPRAGRAGRSTTALVLTPVAAHRTLSGRQVKDRLVRTAGQLAIPALAAVSLLVVGITTFVFDVVVDRTWAVAVGAAMAWC